ncbi:hypothetical protein HY389_02050 [Candidatus Daviesbacteria bacterium]|nr:hypothetical protein [Candidatus Daviesbacteria bacterium]
MSKQSGVAPAAIIVVVVILAAIGGYFVLNKGGGVPSLPIGKALNPNCKYNDPDLCKFINNWKDIKDYSVNSTTTAKSGPKFQTLVEASGTDKTKMVTSQDGKENYALIVIGDTTYTKDYSDNKWWKQVAPKAKAEETKAVDEFKFETKDTPEDKTTYKAMGKEPCGNLTCFKYQVIDPASTDSTEYIYFDDREYMLRKMRSEAKDGTVSESTFAYSGVNISVPSPTKDAKPDQIILPGGATFNTNTNVNDQKVQDLLNQLPSTPPVDNSGE